MAKVPVWEETQDIVPSWGDTADAPSATPSWDETTIQGQKSVFGDITQFASNVTQRLADFSNPVRKSITPPGLKEAVEMAPQIVPGLKRAGQVGAIASDIVIPNLPQVRFARNFAAGALGTGAGMVGAYPAMERLIGGDTKVAKIAESVSGKMNQMARQVAPEDPNFADQLAQGTASMAMFWVPGIGAAKAVANLPRLGTTALKIAKGLNVAIPTVFEAATEQGGIYNDLVEKGVEKTQAAKQAFGGFWKNLILVGITNRFGIGSGEGRALIAAVRSAPIEALQEAGQSIISSTSKEEPINWKEVLTSAGIGGILGGGMGAIQAVVGPKEGSVSEVPEPFDVTGASQLEIDNMNKNPKLTKEAVAAARLSETVLQPKLDSIVQEAISDLTGVKYHGRPKSVKSIFGKAVRKQIEKPGYGVYDMKDLARGMVTATDLESLVTSAQRLKDRGLDLEVFINKPLNRFGYKGFHGSMDLENGVRGEVQFHTPESKKIKDVTDDIYRSWRGYNDKDIDELRRSEPKKWLKYMRDVRLSRKLWRDYWARTPAATKDSISLLSKSVESVTEPSLMPLAGTQDLPTWSNTIGGSDIQNNLPSGSLERSSASLTEGFIPPPPLPTPIPTTSIISQKPGNVNPPQVFFEIAPDPDDVTLTNRWNAMPPEMRQKASEDIVQKIAPKIFDSLGIKGKLETNYGGYLDESNVSYGVTLPENISAEQFVDTAKRIGYTFLQKSVMATSETPFPGSQQFGVIKIELPKKSTQKFINGIYAKLREIEVNGQKQVEGQTTIGDNMAILVDPKQADIDGLAESIDKKLNGLYTIKKDNIFASFIGKEEYDAGDRQPGETPGQRPSIQRKADILRDEAVSEREAYISRFEKSRSAGEKSRFTAKELVETTSEKVDEKLDLIFGTEEANAAIDEGGRATKRYNLANKYRADLEYAIRTRDEAETQQILNAVYKGLGKLGHISEAKVATSPDTEVVSNRIELGEGGYIPLANLTALQKLFRKWLTTERGVGKFIDRANEERIGRIMETVFDAPLTGKELKRYFEKNPSPLLREAVFEALTGKRSIEELPADIQSVVQKMRADIDELSKLIAKDAAPNDAIKVVIERNLGRYLGRYYRLFERKNWRPSDEVISKAKAKLRELHPRTLGQLTEDQMNGVIENILSKGDTTFYRGDKRLDIPQNHFIKRKDIPKEIRDLYGEITDPTWAYLKTMSDMVTVAHNANFLKKISTVENAFTTVPDTAHFLQVPDTARWGAVRGKFTTEEIFEFLKDSIEPSSGGLARFIERAIVDPFKWTKTVGSLPSHPRNLLGNTMFSILGSNSITNPANVPYYWQALKVIMGREGKYRSTWKELVRARVADTQYWGSEMPKLMEEMISDPVDWPDKVLEKAKWPIEKLGQLYNNEDLLYRVAAFLKYRHNGMTVEQAAQEVDKWFTNYARLPQAIKAARRYGVFGPFLSFKANTARILGNAARESVLGLSKGNPVPTMRLAFVLSLISALAAGMSKLFDIDDEEMKKLQDLGPVYRRNSTPTYYRDKDGKIKAFDLSYIWPTGEFQKASNAAIAGDLESFVDSIDLFQHPLFAIYSVLFNNYDTHNRQNVSNRNDPLPRQAADRMANIARQIYVPASLPIPSIGALEKGRIEPGLLTGYQIKTLYDALHGVQDIYGRTRNFPEELKNFLTGVRTWTIYPEDVVTSYKRRKIGELFEAKQEARRYLRMPSITPEERQRRLDDLERRILKIKSDMEAADKIKVK